MNVRGGGGTTLTSMRHVHEVALTRTRLYSSTFNANRNSEHYP